MGWTNTRNNDGSTHMDMINGPGSRRAQFKLLLADFSVFLLIFASRVLATMCRVCVNRFLACLCMGDNNSEYTMLVKCHQLDCGKMSYFIDYINIYLLQLEKYSHGLNLNIIINATKIRMRKSFVFCWIIAIYMVYGVYGGYEPNV